MKKYFLVAIVVIVAISSKFFVYAYESTVDLDNRIDRVADAIMDIMVRKDATYGNKVLVLLEWYKTRFDLKGDDRNEYVANRLLLQLASFHHCTTLGGTWVTVVNECELISKDQCKTLDGTFNECGSACRHEPESTICTLQCVPFCAVELDYTIPESK